MQQWACAVPSAPGTVRIEMEQALEDDCWLKSGVRSAVSAENHDVAPAGLAMAGMLGAGNSAGM